MVGPITNSVTVVGAVTSDLYLLPIPDNSVYGLTVQAVAYDAGDGEAANYEKKWTVKRFAAGVATQIGATVIVIEQEDDAGWDLVCGVDGGNNARVQFTGAAGDTVIVRGSVTFVRQPL